MHKLLARGASIPISDITDGIFGGGGCSNVKVRQSLEIDFFKVTITSRENKISVTVRWNLWSYFISGHHRNELSTVNTLYECKSCSRSRMSDQSFVSVYDITSLHRFSHIFWCGYVKCSILNKGDDLRLSICACYSWEMALNVGLDVSFDNMYDCKLILERGGKLMVRKLI
jgi:hypothetical protein